MCVCVCVSTYTCIDNVNLHLRTWAKHTSAQIDVQAIQYTYAYTACVYAHSLADSTFKSSL